jgi:hypothetical protein
MGALPGVDMKPPVLGCFQPTCRLTASQVTLVIGSHSSNVNYGKDDKEISKTVDFRIARKLRDS